MSDKYVHYYEEQSYEDGQHQNEEHQAGEDEKGEFIFFGIFSGFFN